MDIRGFFTKKRKACAVEPECSVSQLSHTESSEIIADIETSSDVTHPEWENSDNDSIATIESDSETSTVEGGDTCQEIIEVCKDRIQVQRPPGPTDISQTRDTMPVQPKLNAFPLKKFGQQRRAFNPNWYTTFNWIEYSQSEDAVYCFPCRHFPQPNKSANAFVRLGFQNWKKAIGKDGSLTIHNSAEAHKASHVAWCEFQIRTRDGRTLNTMLGEEHCKLVTENRHYIKTICDILRLTASQCIAQRGHREDEKSLNRGNFIEILHLVSRHDNIVKKKLAGARNARYTHHSIQDELINIMARLVRQEITSEISHAGVFSIQVDESKDIAKNEQLSFVMRYVYNDKIHEEFIGFHQAQGLNATSLTSTIIQVLADLTIDIKTCIGQCYDGASVMSGDAAGVQKKFREQCPRALYVHCYSHRLNLVIVDIVKNIEMADEFFSLVQNLYNFISGSAVHAYFMEMQKEMMPGTVPIELKRLSDTRWICQYAACKSIHKAMLPILETLQHYEQDPSNASRRLQAKALLTAMDSKFAICLIMFEVILKRTSIVAKALQASDLQISCAIQLVQSLQEEFSEARDSSESEDSMWSTLWKEAENFIQDNSLPQTIERVRIRRRPITHQDHVFMTTSGQRLVLQSKEDFRKHLFLPTVDRINNELNRRFDNANCTILKSIEALTPRRDTFLQEEVLLPMALHYGSDTQDLSAELHAAKRLLERKSIEDLTNIHDLFTFLTPYKDAFFELHKLILIALTLPVTSAGCERSFSKLKTIKTYLRNRMANERLSSLAVLAINGNRTEELDLDKVVDIFAKIHQNRRIVLV
ncbi:zinc finger MYM-type protein 1-like [Hyperolius riggenbachi]|uniref:zinc finger MYM-type protein 1-like n=1 Tax=Hyperolius riggenbachi TaxID=752182 RepID=UPI0035A3D551